jgi:sulfonate transport system permease protein
MIASLISRLSSPILPRGARSVAMALLIPLTLLAAWAFAAREGWVAEQILPPPGQVYQTFLDLWHQGDLTSNAAISLLRVVEGFVAGTGIGLALGVAMGLSPTIEDYVRPLFTAFAQVPALGLIPLFMLLVGIGETLKILIIARAAFVPVTLNTLRGIRVVPVAYLEVARLFRFRRARLLSRVVLPAALPSIFTGIRYGLTHAWLALVAVELLASSEGLGYLLVYGRQMFQLDLVISSMIVIGVIGFAMDFALAKVEVGLQRWRLAEA